MTSIRPTAALASRIPRAFHALILVALFGFARTAHAESGRLNLHVTTGPIMLSTPLDLERATIGGGYLGAALDYQLAAPFALEATIGGALLADPFDEGPLGAFFGGAGARFRIADDVSGYANEGGRLHGNFSIAAHVGTAVGAGGAAFLIDVEFAYHASIVNPFSLGVYLRPMIAVDSAGPTFALTGGLSMAFEFLSDRVLDPDTDHDGVLNAQDDCPRTPPGTAVNARGCEPDLDHDGVLNEVDACPDTPLGVEVDMRGCVPLVETLVLDGIQFAFDSAEIQPGADPILRNAGQMLIDHPSVRVEIGGHTDNIGEPAHNERLSRQRAESVKNWLRQFGVPPQRMEVRGYGATSPRAPNDTEENRQLNRRIEFRTLH